MIATDDNTIVERATIPFGNLMAKAKGVVKTGKVVAIRETKGTSGGEVVLENDERVPYDVLILATGSRWPEFIRFPDTKEPLQQHVTHWRNKLKSANDVMIIGGGAVGIELSGELRDQYPKKKITIVQSEPMLLNSTYPDKFRMYMGELVRNHNIDMVLNEYVSSIPDSGSGEVILRSGKKITADCIIQAIGPRPNTEFVASSLGFETINHSGLLKITPKMQLQSHPSIFAIGDVIEWQEQKQSAKSDGHVKALVPNVISFLAGQEPTVNYTGSTELILVTLGKGSGAAYFPYLWGIIVGPWFARLAKSRSLFLPIIRSRLGYS